MSNRIREEFLQAKESVRLNKYLSEAGVCSRREADRLIESGKVTVDGVTAQMGMRVTAGQIVKVGKKTVSKQDEMIVLAVNKPKGIVCTEDQRERDSILCGQTGQRFARTSAYDEQRRYHQSDDACGKPP